MTTWLIPLLILIAAALAIYGAMYFGWHYVGNWLIRLKQKWKPKN